MDEASGVEFLFRAPGTHPPAERPRLAAPMDRDTGAIPPQA